MAMPITDAGDDRYASPIAQASMVSPSAVQNFGVGISLNSATMIALNGGR